MSNQWKYKIELASKNVFKEIEKKKGVTLPKEFKDLIIKTNAATPKNNHFMLGNNEKLLGAVLCFNKDEPDVDSVFTALDVVDNKNYIPFAIDPAGNYICLDIITNKVVFIEHETDTVEFTDQTLSEFVDSLY